MRPRCLLLVSALAFAPTVPPVLRAVDVRPPLDPVVRSWDRMMSFHRLHETGEQCLAAGHYRAALVAYSNWEYQTDCGNGADWYNAEKPYRLALCHAGLNDHAEAARVSLGAACDQYMRPYPFADFLAQLYREAGQMNDLHKWLETIDRATMENQLAAGHTLEQVRRHLAYDCSGTNLVRRSLAADTKLAPWPVGMPKPKPGSLPKALQ